jgi:LmbE family N-acetylglucosaminyl deacetylase
VSHNLYQRIYISPHLDDAVLSCGARIYQERRADLPVLVVTVMAGDAPSDGMESPIVAELHTRWELETNSNPVAARRAEDHAALAVLKADVLHWDFPECVYRRHPKAGRFLYPSEASLWGPIHSSEQDLVAQLTRRLTELPLASTGRIYVPLTVGGHVDHRLVRQAAEAQRRGLEKIAYYEEYPYAEHPSALTEVLSEESGWRAEIVSLDDKALDAKAAAIARYHSQISTFYSDAGEIVTRLRAYASVVSQGQGWAERYWRRG